MNLSEIILRHLNDMKSSVVPEKTMDGTYHPKTALVVNDFRRVDIDPYNDFQGITFKENDFCLARCLTNDFAIIAKLIDSWIGLNETLDDLKKIYAKIEVFEKFPLDTFSSDIERENDWNRVKNSFFSQQYSSVNLNLDICLEILDKARTDSTLRVLFPYASLGRICFGKISISKKGSPYLCIAPRRWEPIKEKYFVNLPPDSRQLNFDNLDEAFDAIKNNVDKL